MAEINAIDSLKKNVFIDSVNTEEIIEDSSAKEEKQQEQVKEEKNVFVQADEAKAVTSPIKKSSVASVTQNIADKPIELVNVTESDLGDTFERTTSEKALTTAKENNKNKQGRYEKYKESNFLKNSLKSLHVQTKQEKEDMEKKIKLVYDKIKQAETLEKKEDIVAQFIFENELNISDKELAKLVELYIDVNGINTASLEQLKDVSGIKLNSTNKSFENHNQEVNKADRKAIGLIVKNRLQCKVAQEQSEDIIDIIVNSENPAKFIPCDEEDIVDKMTEFCNSARTAKSQEELIEIIDDAYRYLDENLDKKALEKFVSDYCKAHNINYEDIKKFTYTYSNQRTLSKKMMLALFQQDGDEKIREAIISRASVDIQKSRETLTKVILEKCPPKTQEEAAEIIKATEEFVNFQVADLNELVKSGGYSEETIHQVKKMSEQLVKYAKKQTEQLLSEFFKTEAGQRIKTQARYAIQEVREAKTEFEKSKENTTIAMEEAAEAKKQSKKAISEAQEEKAKAEAIASQNGFKDLDFKTLYKVVKKESPRQASNLLWAKAKEKQAYWAEYDANVAQHHAEFLEDLAKKYFEYAKMKAVAAFLKMQAMLSVRG